MNAISIRKALRNFHDSERADIPVGTVLVIAFIVVPLVLLLIFYRKELVKFFQDQFKEVTTKGQEGAKGP